MNLVKRYAAPSLRGGAFGNASCQEACVYPAASNLRRCIVPRGEGAVPMMMRCAMHNLFRGVGKKGRRKASTPPVTDDPNRTLLGDTVILYFIIPLFMPSIC